MHLLQLLIQVANIDGRVFPCAMLVNTRARTGRRTNILNILTNSFMNNGPDEYTVYNDRRDNGVTHGGHTLPLILAVFPSTLLVCTGRHRDLHSIDIGIYRIMNRRTTTYYERATRENVDAGGASARRDTNRRRNINELDFDFDLFSLIHDTDLKAHDDERDRSYERESHADEPRGIAISPKLRVIAVMTRREPLVALNHVLLLYS